MGTSWKGLILVPAVLVGMGLKAQSQHPDTLFIRQNLTEVLILDEQIDESGSQLNGFRNSQNIEELVEYQPGFTITRRGNYASEINRRGLSSERLTTTINGMKVFGACTDKMDPINSYVSSNNLSSVESSCAEDAKCYGSNVGGQVNLLTKEPRLSSKPKWNNSFNLGVNSVSQGWQSSINSDYSGKNLGVRVNGMITEHQNYRAGGGKEIKYSQYNKVNLGLGLKTKIGERSFIIADYIHDDAWNIGYPALPMDVSQARADIYSITYRKFFEGNFSGNLNWKVYGNNVKHVMDDSEREVVMHMDMPGLSDTYGSYAQLKFNKKWSQEVSVILDGYQNRSFAEMIMYPENERFMYMLTWPDVLRRVLGIYLQDKIFLNESNQIILGMRFDYGVSDVQSELGRKQFEVFGYDLTEARQHEIKTLSLGYNKVINSKNEFKFSLEYAERLPSISEQFAFYIFNSQDGFDYLGDPDIQVESSNKAEITYLHKETSWSFELTGFAQQLDNYIFGEVDSSLSAMTIGANGVKRYVNLPYANIFGIEGGAIWHVTHWLEYYLNASYTYGFDNEQNPLPLMIPLTLSNEFKLKREKNAIYLALIGKAEQNRYSELAGENATPGYMLVNLTYAREFKLMQQSCTLSAGCENIFDTYYRDHSDWLDLPRPGRNIFINFRMDF